MPEIINRNAMDNNQNLPDPAKAALNQIRSDLNRMGDQFKAILPANVPPEKFIRIVMNTVLEKPEFLRMDRQSLFSAALRCAADGLFPDGREAAMIAYGNQITYQAMVGGIYKKLRNSKEIANLFSDIVYDGDEFSIWTDENGKHLEHRPKLGLKRGKSDNAIAVYALVKMRNGEIDYEIVTKEEVENIRSKAKAPNSPAWRDFWGEMAKKTIIKRLAKRLPLSTDVQEFFKRDNEDNFDLKQNSTKNSESRRNEILNMAIAGQPMVEDFRQSSDDVSEAEIVSDKPAIVIKEKSTDPDAFDNFK